MLMDAVGAYLKEQGYKNIYIDFHPEQTPFIALYCWEKITADMYDGTAQHMVQVRVREPTHAKAMAVCTDIVRLLDSGMDEKPIPLEHKGVVIGRIRRLPIVMERTADAVTVYAEIALWGLI